MDERVVVADSLSKRVSMCGARVGWIASRNRELMAALLKFAQARLCPPTLGQVMGSALGEVPEAYFRETIAEYEARRDLVYRELSAMPGVRLERPEGAFYCCARFPVDDGDRFAEFLLRDFALGGETVALAPASGFYGTPGLGRDELRVAYVLGRDRLARAMRVIAAALEAYPGRLPP
jgi:aspartate aminotransferase